MTRDDVTKEQAKTIQAALFPGVNDVVRLKTRMEKAGFRHDDKLYLLVSEAYQASLYLSFEIHALSCGMKERASAYPIGHEGPDENVP